jgi:hypothetical protein
MSVSLHPSKLHRLKVQLLACHVAHVRSIYDALHIPISEMVGRWGKKSTFIISLHECAFRSYNCLNFLSKKLAYESVTKSFRTEPITK